MSPVRFKERVREQPREPQEDIEAPSASQQQPPAARPTRQRPAIRQPVSRAQEVRRVLAHRAKTDRALQSRHPNTTPIAHPESGRIDGPQESRRFQHELREMRQTHDLRDIDDDVEDVATLYEWRAQEHTHRPKSPRWYMILAGGTTVVVVGMLLLGNFIGALAIGLIGSVMYYIAQQKPPIVRYRVMVDGIAINNTLYHYRDLETFNVIYEPGETKTIIFRSKHKLSPYIHMEIGDADPVDIRDILLEFLPEDQEMDEPLVDVVARRLGF